MISEANELLEKNNLSITEKKDNKYLHMGMFRKPIYILYYSYRIYK